MKEIKYMIEIVGVNEKQQQVTLQTNASSAKELLENLQSVLEEKKKFNILKVLGWD